MPRSVAEALLEECVAYYIAALITNVRGVSEQEIACIRNDSKQLAGFFARFTKPDKVRALGRSMHVRALTHLTLRAHTTTSHNHATATRQSHVHR